MKDLTVSTAERQNILNNKYAIECIEKYVGLPCFQFNGEYWLTKQIVADFFEIDERTIEHYLEKY